MTDITSKVRGINDAGNYVFLPYDSKAPIVEPNKRTVKVTYKTIKSGENKGKLAGENSCLLIPPMDSSDVEADIDRLLPYVVDYLESVQDEIVKDAHRNGSVELEPSKLSIDSLIDKLEADKVSQRLNKETLHAWFDSNLAELLTVTFADKLGLSDNPTQEDTDKLNRYITVYRNKYAGLASNVTFYQAQEAQKLVDAIDKCEIEQDAITKRIRDRLVKMTQPVDIEALMDL